MMDFFQNVAELTLGTASTIQPQAPPPIAMQPASQTQSDANDIDWLEIQPRGSGEQAVATRAPDRGKTNLFKPARDNSDRFSTPPDSKPAQHHPVSDRTPDREDRPLLPQQTIILKEIHTEQGQSSGITSSDSAKNKAQPLVEAISRRAVQPIQQAPQQTTTRKNTVHNPARGEMAYPEQKRQNLVSKNPELNDRPANKAEPASARMQEPKQHNHIHIAQELVQKNVTIHSTQSTAVRAQKVQQFQPPTDNPIVVQNRNDAITREFPRHEQADQSSSTINVTIGRVEVKANMPQPVSSAPPEPSQKAKKHPGLSLDDYLRQREGGRK